MLHWSPFWLFCFAGFDCESSWLIQREWSEGESHMALHRCADPRIGWRNSCCRTGKVNPERKDSILVVPQTMALHRQTGVRTGGLEGGKLAAGQENWSGKESPVWQSPSPSPESIRWQSQSASVWHRCLALLMGPRPFSSPFSRLFTDICLNIGTFWDHS